MLLPVSKLDLTSLLVRGPAGAKVSFAVKDGRHYRTAEPLRGAVRIVTCERMVPLLKVVDGLDVDSPRMLLSGFYKHEHRYAQTLHPDADVGHALGLLGEEHFAAPGPMYPRHMEAELKRFEGDAAAAHRSLADDYADRDMLLTGHGLARRAHHYPTADRARMLHAAEWILSGGTTDPPPAIGAPSLRLETRFTAGDIKHTRTILAAADNGAWIVTRARRREHGGRGSSAVERPQRLPSADAFKAWLSAALEEDRAAAGSDPVTELQREPALTRPSSYPVPASIGRLVGVAAPGRRRAAANVSAQDRFGSEQHVASRLADLGLPRSGELDTDLHALAVAAGARRLPALIGAGAVLYGDDDLTRVGGVGPVAARLGALEDEDEESLAVHTTRGGLAHRGLPANPARLRASKRRLRGVYLRPESVFES